MSIGNKLQLQINTRNSFIHKLPKYSSSMTYSALSNLIAPSPVHNEASFGNRQFMAKIDPLGRIAVLEKKIMKNLLNVFFFYFIINKSFKKGRKNK